MGRVCVKLAAGAFDRERLKRLKGATINGRRFRDKATAMWFELWDLAARCDAGGALIDESGRPLTEVNDIAAMIGREPKEVSAMLDFFLAQALIGLDGDVLRLPFGSDICLDTDGAELERIRQKKREAQARWRNGVRAAESAYISTVESTVDSTVDSTVESTDPENPTDSDALSYNNSNNIYINNNISSKSISNSSKKGYRVNKGEYEGEKKGKNGDEISPSIFANTTFSSDVIEAVTDWLQYKRERREAYKPTGLKSLITQVQNNVNRYGEAAVIELIRDCMAANWRGIIFERLKSKERVYAQQVEPISRNPFLAAAMGGDGW